MSGAYRSGSPFEAEDGGDDDSGFGAANRTTEAPTTEFDDEFEFEFDSGDWGVVVCDGGPTAEDEDEDDFDGEMGLWLGCP